MKYYAYMKNREKNIITDWKIVSELLKSGEKFPFMSFESFYEAEEWLNNQCCFKKKDTVLRDAIYFDSGKNGPNGMTRVRLSDKESRDLLPLLSDNGSSIRTSNFNKITKALKIANQYMNLNSYNNLSVVTLTAKCSNNIGELLGFILACELIKIKKTNFFKIIGDSKLIIDYWSKGLYNKKNVNKQTRELIEIAYSLREELNRLGVEFLHISGDFNPADLGDHKK
ncbi:MAG: hypothetical protein ACRCX2_24180 [Paraclostridium sp.]